jgi:[ribosomal protein S5]-alanine N-acetyltransferase
VILETPRLALRELGPEDLDFVADMLADADVMRFYPKLYSRAEAQEWMERQRARYTRDGHALWLVTERASGAPVGQVGLVMQTIDAKPVPEVGYLIHRPYWRRGFASEAARATRDHAFGPLGYPRVISLIRPVNEPSRGVARKMGMAIVGRTMHAGFETDVWGLDRPAVAGRA